VTEFLHAGALGATVVCAGCAALGRPRPGVREVLFLLLMVLGMTDVVARTALVPAVVWSAALVAASVALVAGRRGKPGSAGLSHLRAHSAVSGVLMSGLMLEMTHGHEAAASAGHHGTSVMLLLLGGSVLLVVSAAWAMCAAPWMARVQYAGLAFSIVLTSLAALA
jgi:hypothetical protein